MGLLGASAIDTERKVRASRGGWHSRQVVLALFCLAGVSAPAVALQSPPAEVTRTAQAVAELERAAQALGIQDLQSTSSVLWRSEGTLFSPNQGPRPGVPTKWELRHRQFSDFETGLTYVALEFTTPESSFSRSSVLRQDSGSSDLLEFMAPSPLAVLRLLAKRPADLRLVRSDGSATVISGPLIDRVAELELGPDRLPRALRYIITDPLFGDSVRRFEYSDYRRENGLLLPGSVRQTDAGQPAHVMRTGGAAANVAPPDWTVGMEPRQARPPADDSGFGTERIASGIHLLKQIRGADYNALGVELPEGWMVLETPDGIGDGGQVREALKAIADKPIVYASATHHHDDHSSGMAAFAEDDVTVLTTPGNVAYFQTMIAAPRDFSRPQVRARVSPVANGQRIGPVQFFEISAAPHVEEMLLYYFPEQRILFFSDLGRFNPDGSVEPAREQTCALLSFIETSGLAVDRLYSGHGRPGTVEDVRKAIAMRETPCPGESLRMLCQREHIGSTAIPGTRAKPIIDLLAVVIHNCCG